MPVNSTVKQLRLTQSEIQKLIFEEETLNGNRVNIQILKEDFVFGNTVQITVNYPPFSNNNHQRVVPTIKGECRVIA